MNISTVIPATTLCVALGARRRRDVAASRVKDLELRDSGGAQQAPKRTANAARAKELAVGAVKKALAKVDAPAGEKIDRPKKLAKPPATGKIRKPR